MVAIQRYELQKMDDNYTLVVYLDPNITEFSEEFGTITERKEQWNQQLANLAKGKFPKLKIKYVKIMVGTMLVSSLYLGDPAFAAPQSVSSMEQRQPSLEVYTVKAGDSLYGIAKRHQVTVDAVKEVNQLSNNTIYVGQQLKLPYSTYTVTSGDTLYRIALNHGTTANQIMAYNNLKSSSIFVGQSLKIPYSSNQSNPKPIGTDTTKNTNETTPPNEPIIETDTEAPTTYTVQAGDTLYSISRAFDTSVNKLKELNHLSNNTLSIGQSLLITEPPKQTTPDTKEPVVTGETLNYTVVAGDSLSLIAKKHHITVDAIKKSNNLTSDFIRVGQVLQIPQAQNTQPTETPKPAEPIETDEETEQIPATEDKVTEPTEEEIPEISTYPYTVTVDDTLYSIAKSHGTTVDVLKSLNKLTNETLTIGQTIQVPGEQQQMNEPEPVIIPDAPNISELLPIASNNQAAYTIRGNAEPNTDIQIIVHDASDKEVVQTTTADENGNYEATFNITELADGEIEIAATAMKNGQSSEVKRSSTFKDTIVDAPTVETSADIINQQTQKEFTISGFGKKDSTILLKIRDDNGIERLEEINVSADGNFTQTIDLTELADSTIAFEITQRDALGNISDAVQFQINKDTTAPDAPVFENDAYINTENEKAFAINGTSEVNSDILLTITDEQGTMNTLTGQADKVGQFSIPVNFSDYEDGDITIQLQQTDQAGNISSITRNTLVKHTKIPVVDIQELETIFSENEENYSVTGVSDVESNVDITLFDGEKELKGSATTDQRGNFNLPFNVNSLKDGDITITIQSTSPYGSKSETSIYTVTKDTIAPQNLNLDMDRFVNNKNQEDFLIQGTTKEEEVSVLIRIADDSQQISEEITTKNSTFQLGMDLSNFSDGSLTMEVTQIDKAGNVSEIQEIHIEKDTEISAPSITRSGYAISGDGVVFNIVGTAEPTSLLMFEITNANGEVVRTVEHEVNENGVFNLDISMEGLDINEEYTYNLSQSDQSGNISDIVNPTFLFYSVQRGDTLNAIAKKNNTTVDAIRSLNHITGDTIYVDQQLRLPVTAGDKLSMGYMYFGDVKNFTNQVLATERSFNTVSPSYFDLNRDGTLKLTHLVDPTFVQNMHQQGVRVVPFLSNHWDREVGRAMLANREQTARQIADAVMKYNLDGVNVDIENITHEDREAFTEFIQILRELLPDSKEVSVAVAANPNGWTIGWHGAYDYNALAKSTDYIMMMTYDESYEGSDPGPVASYNWVERSVQYAINQGVPNDKIVIGLAQYGRFWKAGDSVGGKGISNYQIQEMLDKYEHTITFDENSKSTNAVVTIKAEDPKMYLQGTPLAPGTYTVWFENEQSYQAKVSLVQQYGIHGVGHWSIGQENKAIWNSYPTWFSTKDEAVEVSNEVENTAPTETETKVIEPEEPENTYTVAAGDSLWRIAFNNKVSVDELKAANNLTSDMIYVGQKLIIP